MSAKKPGKKAPTLTPQQDLFCQEYIVDLNATAAAIRANYSAKTAGTQACALLKKLHIQERIQALGAERANRLSVNADDVLRELLRIARSDLRSVIKSDGTILPVAEWPNDTAPAISSLEIEEIYEGFGKERVWTGYTKKIKLWDKTRGLEMLGKHLKLFDRAHEDDKPPGPQEILLQWDDGAPVDGQPKGAADGNASPARDTAGDSDESPTPDPAK